MKNTIRFKFQASLLSAIFVVVLAPRYADDARQEPMFSDLAISAIQEISFSGEPDIAFRKMMGARFKYFRQNKVLSGDPYPAWLQAKLIDLGIRRKLFVLHDEKLALKIPLYIGDDNYWYLVSVFGEKNGQNECTTRVLFRYFGALAEDEEKLNDIIPMEFSNVGDFVRLQIFQIPRDLLKSADVLTDRIELEEIMKNPKSNMVFSVFLPIALE